MKLEVATTQGGKRAGAGRPRRGARPSEPEGEMTYEKARTLREIANARLAQIELAKAQGEVLPAADIVAARVRQLAAFRAKMLGIPSSFCGQFVSPARLAEAFDALTQLIHDALDELADGVGRNR